MIMKTLDNGVCETIDGSYIFEHGDIVIYDPILKQVVARYEASEYHNELIYDIQSDYGIHCYMLRYDAGTDTLYSSATGETIIQGSK